MRRVGLIGVLLFALMALTRTLAQDDRILWPTDGWQTSSPEAQGIDSRQLADMLEDIVDSRLNIHSLLVIRSGYLVLEAYGHPYTADTPHQIYSCTKSITSALVGIALEEGYIGGLDQAMVDFFPDRDIANLDAAKQSITLENLLTMTSGLDWQDELTNRRTWSELLNSSDPLQFVLDRPVSHQPGQHFVYNSGISNLLATITADAAGQDLFTFARTHLFDPLGIHPVYWQRDIDGYYMGGTGIQLTPRDMAKFGYLYLNGGQWDGQQIIPADYVAASIHRHTNARPVADGYGYQWWVDLRGYYMASGYGGQYIIVHPGHDLVVVFTAFLTDAQAIRQRTTFFDNLILPAIADEPLPENPEGQAALAAAVGAFAHPAPDAVPALTETALRVSGQPYQFDPAMTGFGSLSLVFSEEGDTARLMLDDQTVEIGLDGLFRSNPQPESSPIFLKGNWTADDRFVIRVDGPGAFAPYELSFAFEADSVRVTRRDTITGQAVTFEGAAA